MQPTIQQRIQADFTRQPLLDHVATLRQRLQQLGACGEQVLVVIGKN